MCCGGGGGRGAAGVADAPPTESCRRPPCRATIGGWASNDALCPSAHNGQATEPGDLRRLWRDSDTSVQELASARGTEPVAPCGDRMKSPSSARRQDISFPRPQLPRLRAPPPRSPAPAANFDRLPAAASPPGACESYLHCHPSRRRRPPSTPSRPPADPSPSSARTATCCKWSTRWKLCARAPLSSASAPRTASSSPSSGEPPPSCRCAWQPTQPVAAAPWRK